MRSHTLSLALILIISLMIPLCGAGEELAGTDEPLHGQTGFTRDSSADLPVGILVMKSGFVSDIGTEYERAFDIAMNDSSPNRISPVIMDGGSTLSVAAAGWNAMIEAVPDLPVIMTVSSWTTNAVYPDAADRGMVQVALGSAAINRSSGEDRLIRFTPGVLQESPVLAAYLDRFDRIAIVGGENDLSNGYFTALDRLLPGKIVQKTRYDQDHVTRTLNTTEIVAATPDVVLLLSVSEGDEVVSLLRSAGVSVPFVGTRVIERNSLAMTPGAEGLIFTSPALNESHPFFASYHGEFGENATFYGAEGYDAFMTLNAAASACGPDTDGLYDWYRNRTWDGALGHISFDEQGNATYPVGWKQVRDGAITGYQI